MLETMHNSRIERTRKAISGDRVWVVPENVPDVTMTCRNLVNL